MKRNFRYDNIDQILEKIVARALFELVDFSKIQKIYDLRVDADNKIMFSQRSKVQEAMLLKNRTLLKSKELRESTSAKYSASKSRSRHTEHKPRVLTRQMSKISRKSKHSTAKIVEQNSSRTKFDQEYTLKNAQNYLEGVKNTLVSPSVASRGGGLEA
jgi:hypothetical protein